MKKLVLSVPTFAFVVATRAALAAGIGLLMSERLPRGKRRAAGAMLLAFGAATTVPAAMAVVRSLRRGRQQDMPRGVGRDVALVGATRFPRKGDDVTSSDATDLVL